MEKRPANSVSFPLILDKSSICLLVSDRQGFTYNADFLPRVLAYPTETGPQTIPWRIKLRRWSRIMTVVWLGGLARRTTPRL